MKCNKLIKIIIKEEISSVFMNETPEVLDEGGYARLIRSIAGLEPNINSLGIVTAENPMAKHLPSQENKKRNKNLSKDLRGLGYGFYQIEGKYGNIEKPFVIPNIKLEDLIKLGRQYKQESVIFVQKQEEKGMLTRLIYIYGEQPEVVSKVVIPINGNPEDFYSSYKNRKFVIPFFDDLFKNKSMEDLKKAA
jgi:Protein of unknown function (DUF3293)